MLNDITPEQRQLYLEQGRIARQEKALFAQEHLDTDHGEDGKHWSELASLYNLRLPNWSAPNTETKHIRRACKKLGVDLNEYVDSCGCRTLAELVKLNPRENAVQFVGLFLEWYHEIQTDTVEYEED